MNNKTDATKQSIEDKIGDILDRVIEFDPEEDSFDGYEPGSPDAVDNQYEWTQRMKKQWTNEILALLAPSSTQKGVDQEFLDEVAERHNTEYPKEYWERGGKFKVVDGEIDVTSKSAEENKCDCHILGQTDCKQDCVPCQ